MAPDDFTSAVPPGKGFLVRLATMDRQRNADQSSADGRREGRERDQKISGVRASVKHEIALDEAEAARQEVLAGQIPDGFFKDEGFGSLGGPMKDVRRAFREEFPDDPDDAA